MRDIGDVPYLASNMSPHAAQRKGSLDGGLRRVQQREPVGRICGAHIATRTYPSTIIGWRMAGRNWRNWPALLPVR